MSDQALESSHDGSEVLFAEVRPLVVMHGLVHCPLFDAGSAIQGRK